MQTDRSSYHVFLHGRELRTPDGRSGAAPTAGQRAPRSDGTPVPMIYVHIMFYMPPSRVLSNARPQSRGSQTPPEIRQNPPKSDRP